MTISELMELTKDYKPGERVLEVLRHYKQSDNIKGLLRWINEDVTLAQFKSFSNLLESVSSMRFVSDDINDERLEELKNDIINALQEINYNIDIIKDFYVRKRRSNEDYKSNINEKQLLINLYIIGGLDLIVETYETVEKIAEMVKNEAGLKDG